MSIQKYMAFLKTVEYGSFTEAAKALDYSQSGISRMINDIEKEWNVILMERGHSGVKLTSVGASYPYGKDPHDRHLRIAPTFPSYEDLCQALEILCLCVQQAALEHTVQEK